MTRLALFLACTIFIGNSALADTFDVKGYKQGISLQDAQSFAKRMGHTLRPLNSTASKTQVSYTVFDRANNYVALLGFCDAKLTLASYSEPGGFNAFVNIVEEFKNTHNYKLLHMGTSRFSGHDEKQYNKLEAILGRDGDAYVVKVLLHAAEGSIALESQVIFDDYTHSECVY